MNKFILSCFTGKSWIEESEPFGFDVLINALGEASVRSEKECNVIKVDRFVDDEEKDLALVDSGEVYYNLENINFVFLLSEIQNVLWDRYKKAFDKDASSNECKKAAEIHNTFYQAYKSIKELR